MFTGLVIGGWSLATFLVYVTAHDTAYGWNELGDHKYELRTVFWLSLLAPFALLFMAGYYIGWTLGKLYYRGTEA